jgi:hypothetical protein
MRLPNFVFGYISAAILSTGCVAAPDFEEGENELETEQTETATDALYGGSTMEGRGSKASVFLASHGCSAVLVGPGKLLTAAHCFPNYAAGSINYNVPIRVEQEWSDASGRYCITAGARKAGSCTGSDFKNATVHIYSGNTGGYPECMVDPGRCSSTDIAAIRLNSGGWTDPADDDRSYAAISDAANSAGTDYTLYGWGNNTYAGTGAGTQRSGVFRVQGVAAGQFYTDAYTKAVCRGDSGAPWFLLTSPERPYLTGLHSSSNKDGENCAPNGDLQRETRVRDKLPFITNRLGPCSRLTDNNIGIYYYQCW